MNRLFTIVLLSILVASNVSIVESKPAPKIIGGITIAPDEFPYFVDVDKCGGALVAPDIVLTAAHCKDRTGQQIVISPYKKYEITSEDNAESRFCETWIPDPMYNETFNFNYDFALCKLDKPVESFYNMSVKLELNDDDAEPVAGDELTIMGLGLVNRVPKEKPDYVQTTKVLSLSNSECLDNFDTAFNPESMICAVGVNEDSDACKGDSGGPLVKRTVAADGSITDVHLGVVSFTVLCAFAPVVYASTSKRIDWIRDTMCNDLNSVAGFCSNGTDTEVSSDNGGVPPVEAVCDPDTEDLLTIDLETDNYGRDLSWELVRMTGNVSVHTRYYHVNNFQDEYNVCLPRAGDCYEWTLRDSYGDGICSGGCRDYTLWINGTDVGGDGNFESNRTEVVCTNEPPPAKEPEDPEGVVDPVDVETVPPEDSVECVDDPEFRWRNKNRLNCKRYLKSDDKVENRCKKRWKSIKVFDWCAETCGIRANLGDCAVDLAGDADRV